MNNLSDCLKFTLAMEGGFSNHPSDPGGATMKGVTIAVYRNWKKDQSITPNDLKKITDDEIQAIYSQNYWTPSKCDVLPSGVDLMVFDMAVNAGVSRSAKILQATVGANPDGQIGPKTLAQVDVIDPIVLINNLSNKQGDFYKSLATFSTFGKGWMNRINARHAAALSIAVKAPANIHQSKPVAKSLIVEDNDPHILSWLKSIV